MYVNLKKWINKDFDINKNQIIGIAIRGVEVMQVKNTVRYIESQTPKKWVVDVLTTLVVLSFSIPFDSIEEAEKCRKELEAE